MLDEKDEEAGLRPRPPTMIERRKVHAAHSVMSGTSVKSPQGNLSTSPVAFLHSDQVSTPSAPPSLYGNGEHGNPHPFVHYGSSSAQSYGAPPAPLGEYSGIPGAYGVPPPLAPYNGAQYEQAGYGAPPIPGTYGPGAYAAYGLDPRYPQYQRQHQGYHKFSPYHQHLQHVQQQQTSGYLNPNTQLPSVTQADISSSSFSLTHQSTQSSCAPPAYADEDVSRWVAARNDIKPRLKEMTVSNDLGEAVGPNSDSATVKPALVLPPVAEATINTPSNVRTKPNSTGPRPTSAPSLYDQDDVYGGM